MKLMNEDYSYNYSKFYGKRDVIFSLIGSAMPRINSKIENQVDTFKSANGEYVDLTRVDILEQVKLGKMLPVEESKITIPSLSQKEWSKKVGRNI